MGNHTQVFEWYQSQWSWVTSNPDFQIVPLFEAEYLRNGMRYRHSYNAITNRNLHKPYLRVLFRMTLSDLQWVSEIFNDTKHCTVSATAEFCFNLCWMLQSLIAAGVVLRKFTLAYVHVFYLHRCWKLPYWLRNMPVTILGTLIRYCIWFALLEITSVRRFAAAYCFT